MVLEYDASASYLLTACRYTYTVVPHVLRKPTLHLCLVLNIGLHIAYSRGIIKDAMHPRTMFFCEHQDVKIISSLTTFFLVFYSNHSYKRYQLLHRVSRTMVSLMMSYTNELCLYLKKEAHEHCRLAIRYCFGSTLMFFTTLRGDAEDSGLVLLKACALITPFERDFLAKYTNEDRAAILLHWSAQATRDGHRCCNIRESKTPGNVLKGMIDKVSQIRMLKQTVTESMKCPIPFQYFHLLNMMIVINLFLWAYEMAMTKSLFAPIVYFFAVLIFLGMMELSAQLADPFGQDDIDFPLTHWITVALEDCIALCEFDTNQVLDPSWQDSLERSGKLCKGDINVDLTMWGDIRDIQDGEDSHHAALSQTSFCERLRRRCWPRQSPEKGAADVEGQEGAYHCLGLESENTQSAGPDSMDSTRTTARSQTRS